MLPAAFASDPNRTAQRVRLLNAYFESAVLKGRQFLCNSFLECSASHRGQFLEGQLHHVGRHFDLKENGVPLRIVVVGQEYGHGPKHVSLTDRHDTILSFGTERRFKAERRFSARNPHMRATTSLLRLLVGRAPGADYEGEFIPIGKTSTHLFETFALVNFLLCSAIGAGRSGDPASPAFRGGGRGQATPTMWRNCARHFRAALEILDPTVVVLQGRSVERHLGPAFDGREAAHATLPVERLKVGQRSALLVRFSHPSAHPPNGWGTNAEQPYLLHTVAPAVSVVRSLVGLNR